MATPIRFADWFAGAAALIRPDGHRLAFESEVRDLLGVGFVRSTNSGRSALYFTLQAMSQLSSRDEVVIPAFVCPSVGRAVVKAGLKPVLCDVGPSGSGLDLESLERAIGRRTLAIVVAHLYGFPCEVAPVIERAHSAGVMVIEDAAQAFGAKLRGKCVGTIADTGIFSFGMSKVLGAAGGGLIVTPNAELARQIEHVLATCSETSKLREAVSIAKLGVLGMLVRSHNLGPIAAVWGGVMRGRHDSDDFDAFICPASHAALASSLLARLDETTRIRRRNALYLAARLSGYEQAVLPEAPPESEPVFLRFPIVVRDIHAKKDLLGSLHALGINTSEMYTRLSFEVLRQFTSRDSQCPRTEYLMERMLNLPTHPYMRKRDLRAVVAAFGLALHCKRSARTQRKRAVVAVN